MKYNKNGQAFDLMGRFFVTENGTENEYCRIKFLLTKNTQVISADQLRTGAFEDISLLEENAYIKTPSIEENVLKETITPLKMIEEVVGQEQLKVIIATNPKGEKIEVADLETFCADNKLDFEAVQSVLEGKQKSHRKWRFLYSVE